MASASSRIRPVLSTILALLASLTAPAVTMAMSAAPAQAAESSPAAVGGTVAGGYVLGSSDGGVYNFGAHDFGSMGGKTLAKPIVGMASTPTGDGYWMVASDGGIFSFGDAAFHGSTGHIALNKPIVGMASTPTGAGYWFVAEDGGIFSFGDAKFFGSTGAITLNKSIVGMAATPTGDGYWFVASDGGIFAFGDAAFKGSTGAITLAKPIVGMAATPSGAGYWMVASDGGIFAFGDAGFFGSTGAITLAKPIVDMAATPTAEGYWLVAEDGGIFTFGNAAYKGSTGGMKLNGKIVDLLPQGGDITAPILHGLSFSPGSVDTSTGPATFEMEARISDDLAGVGGASIWFRSPSGKQSFSAPFYATDTTGIFKPGTPGIFKPGTLPALPAFSEPGTWRLERFSMNDKVGNRVEINEATLAAAGYPTSFTQAGAGDTTPPSLLALSFSPGSVDTSTGPATFDITARISDNLAGVRGASVWFRSPSGKQTFSVPFYPPTNGDIYKPGMPAVLPAYSEPGTWHLFRFSMTDNAGNRVELDEGALAAAGYATTFTQIGPGDTTAPSLLALSVSPGSVDTSTGPATFDIAARISDDVSGVGGASIWFSSPSGNQVFSVPFYGADSDGIFRPGMQAVLPVHSEQGTWHLFRFSMNDKAGNRVDLDEAALAAAGYPTTFEVVRTG